MPKTKLPIPRFELCNNDDELKRLRKRGNTTRVKHWWVRLIARNGKEIWRTSEVYTRRAAALKAAGPICVFPVVDMTGETPVVLDKKLKIPK